MLNDAFLSALEDRLEQIVASFHQIGQVTAVNSPRATVSIAGGSLNLGYPSTSTPAVGDVVQVIGRPGSQFIVCKLT